MDLEVKAYIDKLNEELPRLLLWRREILEQIDIDRNLPGFQITEKYHQITASLNKTIDDLKAEIRELKKGRDDFKELDVFGKRLAEELRKMLSWRQDIMTETSSEQKKLSVAADARLEILVDINNQLINSRLSLDEIKSAKEDFVASLEERQKRLKLKDEELVGKEKLLVARDGNLASKEKQISEDSEKLIKEKKDIALDKKFIIQDRQEIERQILKVNSERVAGQELNRVKEVKLKKLDEKLSALDKKDQTLLLKEEALTKQTDSIASQFDQLDKDKKQLISQQSSLRRAIFLARLRGIKI